MKKLLIFSALFLALPFSAFASFKDVPTSSPYHASIEWLQDNGVVVGYSDGTFRPNNRVNRAEFLKMLYETMDVDVTDVGPDDPFTDVPKNAWYSNYVKKGYADNIIDGYADKTFGAERNINFAEAAKIIGNSFFSEDKYEDAASDEFCMINFDVHYSDEWYSSYMSLIDSYCVIPTGLSGEYGFDPGWNVSRGQMAEMLYRAKANQDNFHPNVMRNYQHEVEDGIMIPAEFGTDLSADNRVQVEFLPSDEDGVWHKLVMEGLVLHGTVEDFENSNGDMVIRFVIDPSERWKVFGLIDSFDIEVDAESMDGKFGKKFKITLNEITNYLQGYEAKEFELDLNE